MNFSDKLRDIRKKEGLSQEQLAERIGVSRQAITKWETGKGLPDIENMMILAEIFKTTIDELVSEAAAKASARVYVSETEYDIDCAKHFDVKIGSACAIEITSGQDEKLHVRLSSETSENIGEIFKVKLDESRNRLDVTCDTKDKISRFEAESSLSVKITLPEKYADHCEIEGETGLLEIRDLRLRRLEYDGKAARTVISGSSGSIELTGRTDYDITADGITGRLDVNQWRARTVVHIEEKNCPAVKNNGRKCSVLFMKNGEAASFESSDEENVISISGIGSELIVDLR